MFLHQQDIERPPKFFEEGASRRDLDQGALGWFCGFVDQLEFYFWLYCVFRGQLLALFILSCCLAVLPVVSCGWIFAKFCNGSCVLRVGLVPTRNSWLNVVGGHSCLEPVILFMDMY